MASAPEEFVELRRLLAMKRHEQPPPGYFNTLAGKVIARIEAEELHRPRSWWSRWLSPAEWAPGLAGANTAIFAGLAMLGGTAWYLKFRSEPAPASTARTDGNLALGTAGSPARTNARDQAQLGGLDLPAWMPFSAAKETSTPLSGTFRNLHRSIQDRVDTTVGVPAGIFGPYNTISTGMPTSIILQVAWPQ